MSVAPITLPLAMQVALRELEPQQIATLAATSKLAGFPTDVKFEWDVGAAYAAMEGHSDQQKLPTVVIEKYLPAAIEALNRAWKDDIVKDAFLKAFTAHHITFSIVAADFVVDKAAMAVWDGFNGLHMEEGRLDIFTKESTFGLHTDRLEQLQIAELLNNSSGTAPPLLSDSVRMTIRVLLQADREVLVARAAKARGLAALMCYLRYRR